jgi:phospho-N-acetylmuramoyl-pentapeptide-transferase
MGLMIAFMIGFVTAAIVGAVVVPFLRKVKAGQMIKEIGPNWHMHKNGTPTMGGVIFIAAVTAACLTAGWANIQSGEYGHLICLLLAIAFGIVGFIDDYEKAIKKNNLGLNAKQKIVMQFGFSLAFALYASKFSGGLMATGEGFAVSSGTEIWIPLFNVYLDLGILYIPFIVFVMVAMSNAVNLTDGLDGLASGVTTLVAFLMAIAGMAFGYTAEVLFFGGIAGGCLGFLMYNKNPAKIFMGDTGSMALGGALAAGAVMMKLEFLLAIAGLVYVMEALSVIIQVGYFKATGGKRFFKMAPLHHHFELSGMGERKVVPMFWAMTLGFCLLATLIMYI